MTPAPYRSQTPGQRRRRAQPPSLRPTGPGRRSASERDALIRIAAATADAYRLEDVMEHAAEAACEAIGAGSLSISRWEADRDALRTLVNVGDLGPGEERFPADELYPLAEFPHVARLLHDGKPYSATLDDRDAAPDVAGILERFGKQCALAVPIVLDGEVWGEIWATTPVGGGPFDADETRFLSAIADRLALVLARGERFQRVSRLAYEDPLTGLANRRAVEERLDQLLAVHPSERPPLTVLLADVDGLKEVNDARGHHVGDESLCRVGDALVAASAPETAAMVGRLAGDEFCVLLEGCRMATAANVAHSALELLGADGQLPLSLSFGAAEAAPDTRSGDLLRAADTAQYAAKRRGGGRLCGADPRQLARVDSGERRAVRPRGSEAQIERVAAALLDALDGEHAGASAIDRVEAVVVGFAAALDAGAWTISRWESDSPVVRSISTAEGRDRRLRGVRVALENEVYRLDEFPQTAAALADGSAAFVARADGDGDPAERRLLVELGFEAVLVATAAHGPGGYLVEIYGDERTAALGPAQLRLRLLLRIAAATTT